MNDQSLTIVILGATGDLAKRKLIPAVYSFLKRNKAIKKFSVICAAIEKTDIETVLEGVKSFISGFEEKEWDSFSKNAHYFSVDFTSLREFKKLSAFVDNIEITNGFVSGSVNRLVYAACMPDLFCAVTKNCAESGLLKGELQDSVKKSETWNRIIYEKPFGHDLKSAKKINKCIAKYFSEDQIYRVDHYLTKEIVSNIAILRFANCVFEPIWKNKFIEQIDIILDEKLSIEVRGKYYDKYGAVRDVVQNHILEIMALIAMESPKKLTGDFIRDERAKLLKKVKFIDGVFGQYKGYLNEQFVEKDSKTETYAQLNFEIKNKRWSGVKFYTRTGKHLDQKLTEIKIKFKKCACLLLSGCPMEQNCLTINIYPKGSFQLSLNVKDPEGHGHSEITKVSMDFCHFCKFENMIPESYEVIIQEVFDGNKAVSVRFDEIEILWKIVDKIYKQNLPIKIY